LVIGGVHIKLKLGKDEPIATKDTATVGKPPEPPQIPKSESDKKESVDKLRTVIKFDQKPATEEPKKQETQIPAKPPTQKEQPASAKPTPATILQEKAPAAPAGDASREDLEQRRTILQNLKDFDFQIKKNQEDITHVTEKVENLSKDLDDLVSLYEIVSEQMNPFVGLSKVTKKRLDALENITSDVDALKTKFGDIEAAIEKGGTLPIKPKDQPKPPETKTKPTDSPTTTSPATTPTPAQPPETLTTPIKPETTTPIPSPTTPPTTPVTPTPQTPPTSPLTTTTTYSTATYTDTDLDVILSKALESILMEQRIDSIMNEFFQELK